MRRRSFLLGGTSLGALALAGRADAVTPMQRLLLLGSAWSPASDANVVAYFDERDLADGAVASWPSRVSAGGSLFQTTGTAQPIKGSGEVVFDGSNDRLIQTLYPIEAPPAFVSGATLPDASGNNGPGTGFTCTGLAHAPDGTWWVGNFGHGNPSVGTGAPSLVHLSADFSTKLAEILIIPLIANANDLQGVAYDTSDDTLWFQDGTNKLIRHISLTGTLITSDQITIPNSDSPNGIAYNAAHDSLFCNTTSNNNIYEMSCATGTALRTYSYIQQGGGDHLFYDATNNILWLSYGADNIPGCVSAINLANSSLIVTYQIPQADCIEGVYIDIPTGTMYLCNDGLYHSGLPPLNRILDFSFPYPVAPFGKTSAVDLFAVARFVTAPVSSDKAILVLGQPLTTTPVEQCNGIGLYGFTSTQLQVVAQTNNGTTRHSVTASSTTTPVLTGTHIIYIRVDTTAHLISFWVDGAAVGAISASTLDAGLLGIGDVINCGGATGNFGNVALKAVGYSFGAADRIRVQKYLSSAFGIPLTG